MRVQIVGISEGINVGLSVCSKVGLSEGVNVGLSTGSKVGLSEGDMGGYSVGDTIYRIIVELKLGTIESWKFRWMIELELVEYMLDFLYVATSEPSTHNVYIINNFQHSRSHHHHC